MQRTETCSPEHGRLVEKSIAIDGSDHAGSNIVGPPINAETAERTEKFGISVYSPSYCLPIAYLSLPYTRSSIRIIHVANRLIDRSIDRSSSPLLSTFYAYKLSHLWFPILSNLTNNCSLLPTDWNS